MPHQGKNMKGDHMLQRLPWLPGNIPSDLPLSGTGHREVCRWGEPTRKSMRLSCSDRRLLFRWCGCFRIFPWYPRGRNQSRRVSLPTRRCSSSSRVFRKMRKIKVLLFFFHQTDHVFLRGKTVMRLIPISVDESHGAFCATFHPLHLPL